jgi:endonuclease-8
VPEGDTIYRAAQALNRALAGGTVTRFESVYPAVTRVADHHRIIGRTVESVSARGKHLLIAFSGGLVLRTHMRMNGSWHLYRPGVRWQRPAQEMRVLVATAQAIAVGFNVPAAELLTGRELERHPELRALGPDWLAEPFDRAEVLRRMRARGTDAIADVLLSQRVAAGIGNVFKSEILFLARVHPFTLVSALSDDALGRIADIARAQLSANVLPRAKTLNPFVGRRTTRSMDPNKRYWVYGRAGQPCRTCGAPILRRKTGADARTTYWCPTCQSDSG